MSSEEQPQFTADGHFEVSISHYFIIGASVFSIFWGIVNVALIKQIDMDDTTAIAKVLEDEGDEEAQSLLGDEVQNNDTSAAVLKRMKFIGEKITEGANSFLGQEYLYLGIFAAAFSILLGLTVDWQEMSVPDQPTNFPYTAVAFLIGCATSIAAGYIGMSIAVYTNTRTTFMCCRDTNDGFLTAFRGGQVLGFVLVGLALLCLDLIVITFKSTWFNGALADLVANAHDNEIDNNNHLKLLTRRLFELVSGYGLGASTVALFGRVGGGIYTKAADVGADLVGKNLKDLKEDDPSNPGTIADNVGDNVGDIAGMGADLFGSLAEATCAALVVSSTSIELINTTDALYFPLMITAAGIVASFISVIFVHTTKVTVENVKTILTLQLLYSTIFMTIATIPIIYVLPDEFTIPKANPTNPPLTINHWVIYACILFGLWSGMIIGFCTDYFTSNSSAPVLVLVDACDSGPAPNIIQGLALGYLSCVIPVLCLAATIGFAFNTAGLYGIGISALGMLGALPVALSIDGYGPIADNAGGIAEMCGLPSVIRDRTDALDAAGNCTAAIGKGFAIGSAALVGLALFGAFITRVDQGGVDILMPVQFCFLLIGAMLPYAFSALTMKAVGDAADQMMKFIIQDYERGQETIKAGGIYHPDYDGCIKISTDASLAKMIVPGILVLGSPLLSGFLFGPDAVAGLLAGIIVSGVQVAISASNTGGAWDNCKKEVEKQRSAFKAKCKLETGKSLDAIKEEYDSLPEGDDTKVQLYNKWIKKALYYKEKHVAAVVGDTVGDPLKDTSGPAINILIKLSAITSLVFGSYIKNYHAFNN